MNTPQVGDHFVLDDVEYVVNRITVERNGRVAIDCMSVAELRRRYENLAELLGDNGDRSTTAERDDS